MRVACAVEGERYLRHSAAMLHSLLARNPGSEVVIDYLHTDDTTSRSRRRLSTMVARLGGEITFHAVPDTWVEGFPIQGFTRKATWYRICLDGLLPAVDRVLWLDVDLLVLDSLEPLWSTALGGNVVGAVTNVPPGPDRSYVERPELGGDPYFNAGVLLLDLEAMRRERLGERLREFTVEHAPRLRWRDQDSLNEVLHDRRLALHPRWNCMNSIIQFDYATDYLDAAAVAEARSEPAVRHFEGPLENKPWHLLSDPRSRRQYMEHRRQTPWPRLWPEGCTPPNMLRYARRLLFIVPRRLVSSARRHRYEWIRHRAVRLWFAVWTRTGRRPVGRLFLNDLIAKTENFAHTTWLGTPVWQNTLDLWTIQETIAEVRPALLIETGTNRGGSALFYAHLMELLGTGSVVTIDVERLHELDHPRIEFIHGGSTEPGVVERVRERAAAAEGPVMVILDADHAQAHVAQELELYGPLVTPGSYLLSQDGVIDQLLIFSDSRPGPLGANDAFLARHPEFEYDRERNERFIVTQHPHGWMRRVA